jgi:predicted nucleotidyltransferase
MYTDVPTGKVIVIGYSKQEKYIYSYISHFPNGFGERAIAFYRYKNVDKKNILRAISNNGIYCSSEKIYTV